MPYVKDDAQLRNGSGSMKAVNAATEDMEARRLQAEEEALALASMMRRRIQNVSNE